MQTGSTELKLDDCCQYLQQLEQIRFYQTATSIGATCKSQSADLEDKTVNLVDKNKTTMGKCRFCGTVHAFRNCPAFGKTCRKCNKKNHFTTVCRSNKAHHVSASSLDDSYDNQSQLDSEVFTLAVHNTDTDSKIMKVVMINGARLLMQIDTGSQATLIPRNHWNKLGQPKLRKTKLRLRQFDRSTIQTKGEFDTMVETDSKFHLLTIVVAQCTKRHGLLGTDYIEKVEQKEVNSLNGTSRKSKTKLGCLENYEAKIRIREDARPSYFEARNLPVHIKKAVVDRLQVEIEAGILEKDTSGGSNWASPIVAVRKANGKIRVCADYKVGVNQKICSDSHPIPNAETELSRLVGCRYFAKIDLEDAYHQIPLHPESREITTINTPIGLLRYTRLPNGIKNGSALCQSAMEAVVGRAMDKVFIYQDDICIGGVSDKELETRLNDVLFKLENAGLTINKEKSVFKSQNISFLGYTITAEGVRPDKMLVKKLIDINQPKDRKELSMFLGLANFYRKFVDRFSDICSPLEELRSSKIPYVWGNRQKAAFELLKEKLATRPVMKLFDPSKMLTLTTDASEEAIAGIISQEGHPIWYLSRRLTPAESAYSNIEREALAIIWCVNRAKNFLLGAKFVLIATDHQPLEFILNPSKELPKVTSARILRWAIQLAAYDYEIKYIKGKDLPHVDALSRLSINNNDPEVDDDSCCDSFIHWMQTDVLNKEELRKATIVDSVLCSIIKRIKTNNWSNCSIAERPFKSVKDLLTVEEGILCKGDLIIPPSTLRERVISSVHDDTHPGSTATRNRLKLESWWPGYCDQVESYLKKCHVCSEIKPPLKKTEHTWPIETAAWNRVHMDHACIKDFGLLLILVDSFSGWPEVIRVKDRLASTVKTALQTAFSRLGVPKVLVSDNAAEFCDSNLCSWLQKIGCTPMKTPPNHPSSNGLAERMVATIKNGLKAFDKQTSSFDSYLARLLLNYRSIPHASRKQSPSELMGRQIRSPLTSSFLIDSELWYFPTPNQLPETAKFIAQHGQNTMIVSRGERVSLVHNDQLKSKNSESTPMLDNCGQSVTSPDSLLDTVPATCVESQDNNTDGNTSTVNIPIPTADSNARRSLRANKGIPPVRYGIQKSPR